MRIGYISNDLECAIFCQNLTDPICQTKRLVFRKSKTLPFGPGPPSLVTPTPNKNTF